MNMTSATSGSTQFAWKPDCRWKKTRPTPAASMASAGHHQNCGGPIAFMARRDEVPILEYELLEDIEESLRSNDMAAIRERIEDIGELQEWLDLDTFDRRAINHRLKQFSANDPAWRLG